MTCGPQLQMVLSEVSDSSSPALQAVRWLAQYHKGGSGSGAMDRVAAALEDGSFSGDPTTLLVAATLYMLEDRVAEALKLCHLLPSLEL